MENSIDTVLNALLSDKNASKALTEVLNLNKEITDKKFDMQITNEKSNRIQQKIDILKTVEPILSEKNREHIRFFIKVLTIAKIISEIE